MAAEERISLTGEGREVEGYLALPDGGVTRSPAVIVAHEIWGLVDHIEDDVARRFAGEGYATLAPDLYTGHWRDVLSEERIAAGMAFLRSAPRKFSTALGRFDLRSRINPRGETGRHDDANESEETGAAPAVRQ